MNCSELIGTSGALGKQNEFLPNVYWQNLKKNTGTQGLNLYNGKIETVHQIASDLIRLNNDIYAFGKQLYSSLPDIEVILQSFNDKDFDEDLVEVAYAELNSLCGLDQDQRIYVCEVIQLFVIETLTALCYWVRESIVDLNGL